jgi:hypothetical protein
LAILKISAVSKCRAITPMPMFVHFKNEMVVKISSVSNFVCWAGLCIIAGGPDNYLREAS